MSRPPIHVPTRDPTPKEVMIHPTCGNVKPLAFTKYSERKGITIAPARLIKVTSDNSQISRERPWKLLI